MPETVIKQRGAHSIELKLRYMLPSDQERSREKYRVNLHLFLPHAFSVDQASYPSERFYDNKKLYVRFNTPALATAELLDPSSEISPLARLEQLLNRQATGEPIDEETFVYESKMLGAVYKSLLRGTFGGMSAITSDTRIRPDVTQPDPNDPMTEEDGEDSDEDSHTAEEDRKKDAKIRARALHDVAQRFHRVTKSVLKLPSLEGLHQHCAMIDEHLSLLIERYYTAFVNYHHLADKDPGLFKTMSKIIISEARHRADQRYPTVLPEMDDEANLEQYVYREKMLKKYTSEVLFLRVKTTNEARRIEHFLYAIAAGIAMIFATAIAFFGQTVFGGISLSLFLLLVVSYMLKDRIKDIFRDLFRRSLGRRFYDRREHLYDTVFRKKLAILRERFSFVRPKDEDQSVLDLRARGAFETQLARTEPESHILYRKDVTVKASALRRLHRRVRGLADVTILDLSHLLGSLAHQSSPIPVVVGKKAVEVESVERIYHLNMVVHYQSSSDSIMERFRLVVNRAGVKRIEPVIRVDSSCNDHT